MISAGSGPWLFLKARKSASALRFVCFPHAGVGASAYRQWQGGMPADIEICPVQLPGRESRFRESPHRSVESLISAVTPALLPMLDRPYAVFGHSMGAVVASEFVRELARIGGPSPVHLFVSGRRALHLGDSEPPLRHLDDTAFVSEIQRRYGGIPAEVASDRELMQLVLPGLRADIELIETYSHKPDPLIECPVTVFGGLDDARATPSELAAWQAIAAPPIDVRTFPGGHFYLTQHRTALLDAISAKLRPVLASIGRAPTNILQAAVR